MCIVIPKFSPSAGRLIRAQMKDICIVQKGQRTLWRSPASPAAARTHSVPLIAYRSIRKKKYRCVEDRAIIQMKQSENYRDHLNDQLGINHKLKWTTCILFLFSCYPDHLREWGIGNSQCHHTYTHRLTMDSLSQILFPLCNKGKQFLH